MLGSFAASKIPSGIRMRSGRLAPNVVHPTTPLELADRGRYRL